MIVKKQWCSDYHCCISLFNKVGTYVLHSFKSYSWRVQDLEWLEHLKIFLAGNKTSGFFPFNHSGKTIHRHPLEIFLAYGSHVPFLCYWSPQRSQSVDLQWQSIDTGNIVTKWAYLVWINFCADLMS